MSEWTPPEGESCSDLSVLEEAVTASLAAFKGEGFVVLGLAFSFPVEAREKGEGSVKVRKNEARECVPRPEGGKGGMTAAAGGTC